MRSSFSIWSASVVLMSVAMTVAPSCASREAVARPIPPAAPVMTATLPANRFMIVLS
ncbi:Uncharacterised protein [Mycobacteroides abscessus subsp. abscessus]|nr:Uncharacterised protein [Mycobacteroides abscessus subsp. abscessus]